VVLWRDRVLAVRREETCALRADLKQRGGGDTILPSIRPVPPTATHSLSISVSVSPIGIANRPSSHNPRPWASAAGSGPPSEGLKASSATWRGVVRNARQGSIQTSYLMRMPGGMMHGCPEFSLPAETRSWQLMLSWLDSHPVRQEKRYYRGLES
jgi:hypothetical protein